MAFIRWEQHGRSDVEIPSLVAEIAEELGAGWSVAEDRYGNTGRVELHGPDGIELCLHVGRAQVAVRGIHGGVGGNPPRVYGCKQPVIRFSVAKTPRRMAAEITRRLLPSAREDAAILAAARAERDARLAGRLDTLLKAAELLGGDLTWDERGTAGRPAEFNHASTRARPSDAPHVVIELRDYEGSDHADEIRVSRLTHEEVLAIVEAAARLIAARRAA